MLRNFLCFFKDQTFTTPLTAKSSTPTEGFFCNFGKASHSTDYGSESFSNCSFNLNYGFDVVMAASQFHASKAKNHNF